MDLSFWLTTLSLAVLAYAGAQWVWNSYGADWRAARGAGKTAEAAPSVKPKRRAPAFKARSRRSNVQNAVNAGSERQDAKQEAVNVQPNVQRSEPPAPPAGDVATPDGSFTLSARELVQLTEALHQRREGATVEEAVCRAFGVTKGGSEGYRRAKAIYDAATVAPGAAPAGTYAAPEKQPVRRSRAAAR